MQKRLLGQVFKKGFCHALCPRASQVLAWFSAETEVLVSCSDGTDRLQHGGAERWSVQNESGTFYNEAGFGDITFPSRFIEEVAR